MGYRLIAVVASLVATVPCADKPTMLQKTAITYGRKSETPRDFTDTTSADSPPGTRNRLGVPNFVTYLD